VQDGKARPEPQDGRYALIRMSPLVLSLLASLAQSDWPQFGGPNGDSVVGPLATKFDWVEGGPKVLWRASTGPGFGGAAVQGGEVFLLDCELGESEMLRVFDLESGKEKWTCAYEARGRVGFPGPRCVPAVTADAVYTSGPLGNVTCFDRATHEIRWEEHVRETYGGEDPGFGFSSSPLLVGDLVIFSALGETVGLVALDRKTGEERWVSDGVGFSHSTPALLTLLGEPQLVILATGVQATGQDEAAPMTITSFDPKNGKTKWRHEMTLTRLPIPQAVRIDDRRIFVTGGYRGGSTLLALESKDGKVAVRELFHSERGAQVHAPLLCGENLYLLANENANYSRPKQEEGGLMCIGLDGKERWRSGASPYFGLGNALLAGEHLLIQDGFDGTLRVVHVNPERFELVAEARLFPDKGSRDGQMWAPMALSGTHLLMRSQEELLCVQL
jgi:outer membrane protein assembly factor BamB